MNDVVLQAKENGKKSQQPAYAEVAKTFQAICEHPQLMTKTASSQPTIDDCGMLVKVYRKVVIHEH